MRASAETKSVCLHSQSQPQKLCVDDESLDSLVLVRTGAAINEGASQPRREIATLERKAFDRLSCALSRIYYLAAAMYYCTSLARLSQTTTVMDFF